MMVESLVVGIFYTDVNGRLCIQSVSGLLNRPSVCLKDRSRRLGPNDRLGGPASAQQWATTMRAYWKGREGGKEETGGTRNGGAKMIQSNVLRMFGKAFGPKGGRGNLDVQRNERFA